MIVDNIRADLLTARKAKNTTTVALLSTLLSEADSVGKQAGNRKSTDDEVTLVIKKFIANLKETSAIAAAASDSTTVERIAGELALVSGYAPEQLSEDEIRVALQSLYDAGSTNLGSLMAGMRTQYFSRYDGGVASRIARAILPA